MVEIYLIQLEKYHPIYHFTSPNNLNKIIDSNKDGFIMNEDSDTITNTYSNNSNPSNNSNL